MSPLGGNLHLAIPLYSVDLGPDFKMSLELHYDSLMWDASDPAYSSGWIPARMVRGKDPAGLGWRLNIPRVRSVAFSNSAHTAYTQRSYYFQSADGAMHRLYRDGCTLNTTWSTQDQSGIRALSEANAPLTPELVTKWIVWEASGVKYIMENIVGEDQQDDTTWYYKMTHWDTTRIESATRTATSPPVATRWINIQWNDSQMGHDGGYHYYCPVAMLDSFGRAISFACASGPTTEGYRGVNQDGGKLTSIEFYGTPDPITGVSRGLRYNLSQEYREIIDPFSTTPCPINYPNCPHNIPRPGILVLTGLSLEVSDGELFGPVSPPKAFAFAYDNSGMLIDVTLPGGGRRTYDYAPAHYWRSVFPDTFDTPTLQEQFNFFPSYGLRRRTLEVDGRSYVWNYTRENENCSESAYDQCFNHPNKVTVLMPQDYMNLSAARSTTVYRYRATRRDGDTSDGGHVTPGTTSPLDGTLASVEVYAGSEGAGRLLRRSLYEYAYDTPPAVPSCNTVYNLLGHTVDGVRLSKRTTIIEDDRKATHDKRVVEYANWSNLPGNTRVAAEMREYIADGATLYRKTTLGYQTVAGPDGNSMPRRSWTRTLRSDGTPMAETSYSYNAYGQATSVRQLYQPGGSPGALSANDIIRTVTYDPATGLPSRVDVGTGAQPTAFGETYEWDWGYLSSRRTLGFAYDSFRVVPDRMTGAVLEEHRPWGGGRRFEYTESGEPAAIRPLVGSADPVTAYEYASNQRTTTVGDPVASSVIRRIEITDGLGRLKEERALKYDDEFVDQWVARSFTRDWSGAVETASEWAPLGAPNVRVTRTERYGLYKSSEADPGVLVVDPLGRVRQVVAPDGSISTLDFIGLVTTKTNHDLQGGTIYLPTTFDRAVAETADIFGRTVEVNPLAGAVTRATYDELNRPLSVVLTAGTSQTRERRYDPLGRMTLLREPERGTIWFGSHFGDTVQPDGYNALGGVQRYQTSAGAEDPAVYYSRLTYDSAGRLKLAEREVEGGARTKVSEFLYDLAANGNGDSANGRLGRAISYDDSGSLRFQTDYFYQEASGRLDRSTSTFGAWATPQTTYYGYDDMGQVNSLTYPKSQPPGSQVSSSITLTRTHGFTRSIQSSRGNIVTSALYDHGGALKQWNAGSGVRSLLVPDPEMQGRVQEFKVTNATGGVLWTTGLYDFDGGGNIKSIGADLFVYDLLGRLSEAQMPGPTGSPLYHQTYSYDEFGNLYGKALQVDAGLPSGTLFNIEPNTNRIAGLNQATDWTYRADGALTHDDSFDYYYDNAGRLAEIHVAGTPIAEYGYDASGMRVYREEDHGKEVFYFRGLDGEVLSQFSRPAGSTLTPQWDRDFVYLEGRRVAMIENPVPGGPSWRVTSSGTSGISLNWFSCSDYDWYGFVVYRKAPGEAEFSPIYASGQAITTTGTSYTDADVTPGTSYWYRLACVDMAGNEGPTSPERPITHFDTTPPPAPTGLNATAGNEVVTLQWAPPASPPNDLAGYYIYRRLTGGQYAATPLNAYPLMTPTYQDLAVVNGTTYYYVAKSVDTAGLLSAASNEVSAKPKVFQQTWLPPGLSGQPLIGADLDGEIMPYRTIGQGVPYAIVFLHHDHLGTIRFATNMSASQMELHKYLPYGEEAQVTSSASPFRYAGYEFDPESRMHYVGARFFDEHSSRWLTPDPLGAGYEYAPSNPLSFRDPTGLQKDPVYCWYGPIGKECSQNEEVDGNNPAPTQYMNGSYFAPPTRFPKVSTWVGGAEAGDGFWREVKRICRFIPSGRVVGVSLGAGLVGGGVGGGEILVNYNSGQISAFGFGGGQAGWNGALAGSLYQGFVWGGLNDSNSNYSGGFVGGNFAGGLGVFGATSSSGLVPNGSVRVGGVSVGGSFIGGITFGASVTQYSDPLQLGRYAGFNAFDAVLYAARQVCN